MSQTKKLSLVEAITNTFAGLFVAFAVQLIIYPMMGIAVRLEQNLILTGVFTGVSILRGYCLRRIFNRMRPAKKYICADEDLQPVECERHKGCKYCPHYILTG